MYLGQRKVHQEEVKQKFECGKFGWLARIYTPDLNISVLSVKAAVNEMRGFALGGPDNRIRMDFADVENMPPPRGYQGSDYDPNIARHTTHTLFIYLGVCNTYYYFYILGVFTIRCMGINLSFYRGHIIF